MWVCFVDLSVVWLVLVGFVDVVFRCSVVFILFVHFCFAGWLLVLVGCFAFVSALWICWCPLIWPLRSGFVDFGFVAVRRFGCCGLVVLIFFDFVDDVLFSWCLAGVG